MKESKDKFTKSLTLILPAFFLLFWTMLHNNIETNHSNLVFHINNGLVVLAATTLTFLVVMKINFNQVVIQAKLEQQNKDYSIIVKFLEKRIKDLTEKLELTEEKANTLLTKIKYLNQLAIVPDLALYLMEKIVSVAEQYKTDFNIEISNSFKSINNIQIEDLKQALNLMLTPILQNLNNIKIKKSGDINLFILENNGQVIFKVMHDYTGNQINTELLEWNVRKILQNYGGNFIVEHEYEHEDGLNVLTLTVNIPKENKSKRTKTA